MHEGSYFTYIMASRSHTVYIGVTGERLDMNPTWADLSRDRYDAEPADYRRALDPMNS